MKTQEHPNSNYTKINIVQWWAAIFRKAEILHRFTFLPPLSLFLIKTQFHLHPLTQFRGGRCTGSLLFLSLSDSLSCEFNFLKFLITSEWDGAKVSPRELSAFLTLFPALFSPHDWYFTKEFFDHYGAILPTPPAPSCVLSSVATQRDVQGLQVERDDDSVQSSAA